MGFLAESHALVEQLDKRLMLAHNELLDQDRDQLRSRIDAFRKSLANCDLLKWAEEAVSPPPTNP
jgi:hypothetical protein